jgi:hypothetical protein
MKNVTVSLAVNALTFIAPAIGLIHLTVEIYLSFSASVISFTFSVAEIRLALSIAESVLTFCALMISFTSGTMETGGINPEIIL